MFSIRKIRRISIHCIFWFLNYTYITGGDIIWVGFDNASGSLGYAYAYGMFFNAFLFYIQVFWLVPYLYIKNKNDKFWIITILVFTLITMIETSCDYLTARIFNIEMLQSNAISVILIGWFINNSVFHLLYSLVGFYYIFQFEYVKSEQIKHSLLKETHKTELKYLKAQLNPHFLFNGMNSVYHLIGKNNVLAKHTLIQFSELLRYQLYDSVTSYISLKKELDYVSKYIHLEAVRRGEDIRLNHIINFENPTTQIAPLLLTPFVENAFKHCSNYADSEANEIHIEINEIAGVLTLYASNTYDTLGSKNGIGGIGLQNVKRRLALLYPDKHKIDITKQQGNFTVHLTITL